jgi:hypothetical protein
MDGGTGSGGGDMDDESPLGDFPCRNWSTGLVSNGWGCMPPPSLREVGDAIVDMETLGGGTKGDVVALLWDMLCRNWPGMVSGDLRMLSPMLGKVCNSAMGVTAVVGWGSTGARPETDPAVRSTMFAARNLFLFLNHKSKMQMADKAVVHPMTPPAMAPTFVLHIMKIR